MKQLSTAVANIINDYPDLIEQSNWETLHKILKNRSDLSTHINFIKALVRCDIPIVPYSLEEIDDYLETIFDMNSSHFQIVSRIDDDAILTLCNEEVANALTHILQMTTYILGQDFALEGKGQQNNKTPIIILEGVYKDKKRAHGIGIGTTYCETISVSIPTDNNIILEDYSGPYYFNTADMYEEKSNTVKVISIDNDVQFESNIDGALADWITTFFNI